MKKIALGMSGGVDSSLCAHLLAEQGYEVTGVYLECWRAPGCRTEEDRKDALKVALSLNIPFKVLDFKKEYKDRVVEYFFDEYRQGRTPNPDVACNKEIKFGMFYDWAMENSFDAIATGHYAGKNLSNHLIIPKDKHKDQTYFMYPITKTQLKHTIFPLQDLTKDEVRKLAKDRKIHVADKKDSVGICFIGDINVHDFLMERLGENPGEVVDRQGRVIGKHNGLWFYTIGQRHGFEILPSTKITTPDGEEVDRTNIPPFYVIGKDAKKNQLIVGFGAEANTKKFSLENLHWIDESQKIEGYANIKIRIRHTGELLPALFEETKSGAKITLDEPTWGVAEGQSGVIYVGKICLGGGVIQYSQQL